ncbi:MAG: Smr/MutS family protein, partial [Deltaproteobacteria bacterium]|nr:Smr/MutS family protein [Deltaproteobacteria bacterium]
MKKRRKHSREEEAIRVPIEDVLDLHTFQAKEVPGLLEEYIDACLKEDIFSVRIIHGKGQGV